MYRSKSRLFASEFLIKIAGICTSILQEQARQYKDAFRKKSTYNCGEIGRGYALVHNIVEIYIFEEWLSFDLFCVLFAGSKTAYRVASEQLKGCSALVGAVNREGRKKEVLFVRWKRHPEA
jgi:hypothetical protein